MTIAHVLVLDRLQYTYAGFQNFLRDQLFQEQYENVCKQSIDTQYLPKTLMRLATQVLS